MAHVLDIRVARSVGQLVDAVAQGVAVDLLRLTLPIL